MNAMEHSKVSLDGTYRIVAYLRLHSILPSTKIQLKRYVPKKSFFEGVPNHLRITPFAFEPK